MKEQARRLLSYFPGQLSPSKDFWRLKEQGSGSILACYNDSRLSLGDRINLTSQTCESKKELQRSCLYVNLHLLSTALEEAGRVHSFVRHCYEQVECRAKA